MNYSKCRQNKVFVRNQWIKVIERKPFLWCHPKGDAPFVLKPLLFQFRSDCICLCTTSNTIVIYLQFWTIAMIEICSVKNLKEKTWKKKQSTLGASISSNINFSTCSTKASSCNMTHVSFQRLRGKTCVIAAVEKRVCCLFSTILAFLRLQTTQTSVSLAFQVDIFLRAHTHPICWTKNTSPSQGTQTVEMTFV